MRFYWSDRFLREGNIFCWKNGVLYRLATDIDAFTEEKNFHWTACGHWTKSELDANGYEFIGKIEPWARKLKKRPASRIEGEK